MKASLTIHVETLWTNRAELNIEAVSMMFEAARLMAMEARGENERALFGQEALNKRYRELDAREARLDERDKRVTDRETGAEAHDLEAEERETRADVREREQMEHDLAPRPDS